LKGRAHIRVCALPVNRKCWKFSLFLVRYHNTAWAGTDRRNGGSSIMEQLLIGIFGVKDHLTTGQECARAVLIFFYGLLMLRVSGKRTFAKWSAFDIVISFIVGSALSRAMTGSASLPGTMAAVLVLVLLHRVVAHASAWSPALSCLFEGRPVCLGRDGRLFHAARQRHAISLTDIGEAMREKQLNGLDDLAKVQELTLEPDGRLSILKRQ
jgi:uncharacterized membrane protein YcaP (DUF421 family)